MDPVRQVTACGIAIAYVKKAIEEGSYYFFRYFDTQAFDLHKVTTEKEAIDAIHYLMNNHHSGGGTDIDMAIRTAMDDINNPKMFKQEAGDKNDALYDKADILVITDGEDDVEVTREQLEAKKIVLHSFLLEDSNPKLEKISTTYKVIDRREMNKLLRK